jgi:PAS domain S-box-containing protein/putative nucleotidyltransferase with HDIG domain
MEIAKELRILMLEDEPDDAELARRELRKSGMAFVSECVDNREAFVAALDEFAPDVILADYKLPAFDGLSALAIARERRPQAAFIFVSGAMGEEFAIEMLHQGAADYVLKGRLSKLVPAVHRARQEAEQQRRRKEAEEALAESEERFRNMAESAQDCIAILDSEGAITYWNRAAERMFGHERASVLGRNMHEMLVPDRYRDAYTKGWPHFRATGQGEVIGRTFEMSALRIDGVEFPVELSISSAPIKGEWHAIGIVRDISERKQADQALRRSNRFLRTLSRCNEALVHATDEADLLQDMCRIVVDVGEFALAWVAYIEATTARPMAQSGERAAEYVSAFGLDGDMDNACRPAVKALATGSLEVMNDIAADTEYPSWRQRALDCGYRSAIALPLKSNGGVVGTLNIYSAEAGAFGEAEVGLLSELAGDLAFGITTLRVRAEREENALKLEKALEDTIQAIATTIERRDPYTAGHQKRVARLAAAIARELGLSEMHINGVLRGAEIHDIGKIYVPSEILSRPGRLSDVEFSLIKTHPQVGYDIVKEIDFPWPVAAMILQHHERLDGRGYPNGLKGDEIIREAKILAVADVVDAMVSHRPYRSALGVEAALGEIEKNSGILYDEAVAAACLRLFRERGFEFD